jgi:hypothetical protein
MSVRILEDIDQIIRQVLPLSEYSEGCRLISAAAAYGLREYGIHAESELVALWKSSANCWIPHYIVVADRKILDFKRRLFGKFINGEVTQVGADITASTQHDGWYPDGRRYKRHPTATLFTGKYLYDFMTFFSSKDPEIGRCEPALTK